MVIESLTIIAGILIAEFLFRPKANLYQNVISLILLVVIFSLIVQKTYYLPGADRYLYFYLFVLSFFSTIFSRFLTFSFSYSYEKVKQKVKKRRERSIKQITIALITYLKKEGWENRKIIRAIRMIGLDKKIAEKVLRVIG